MESFDGLCEEHTLGEGFLEQQDSLLEGPALSQDGLGIAGHEKSSLILGVARVRRDSALDVVRLAAALKKMSAEDRKALLAGLERLAAVAGG
jgi:hypothetical protein